jgi:hypothetical protein
MGGLDEKVPRYAYAGKRQKGKGKREKAKGKRQKAEGRRQKGIGELLVLSG